MRILLVLDSLAPGGAEHSTVALLPALLDRGVEPGVVVLHDRPGLGDEVRGLGVPVQWVSSAGRGRPGWIHGLHGAIQAQRPDLVHTCLFEADVCGRTAAAWSRVPVVSTLPSELYGPGHRHDPALRAAKVLASQLLDAGTARLARRLHAVSVQVADTMAVRLRYPRHRIDVIPRGRPAALAAAASGRSAHAELRRSLGIAPDQPVVLVVARHEWAKGIDRAIEALPALAAVRPGLRLLVAGSTGDHTPALEALVEDLGLAGVVQFLGYRRDVADLLGMSDVFLLLSRREGLPGALLEAMAAATPAVVGDLPQVLEVAGPDLVEVVDAADPEQVAAAVSAVLADPEKARQRALAARDRFLETYTLERVADAMMSFYRRVLA